MREREHLRRTRVRPINKHERRVGIGEDKTPKFGRVQLAARGVADYTIDNHQNANPPGGLAQNAECMVQVPIRLAQPSSIPKARRILVETSCTSSKGLADPIMGNCSWPNSIR